MAIKRIGISMREVRDPATGEIRDALSREWYGFLNSVFGGVLVIPLPNTGSGISLLLTHDRFDGFILSGGGHIGESDIRDETERRIIGHAVDHGIPLVGVCRGFQMICRYYGCPLSPCPKERHVATRHSVKMIVPDKQAWETDVNSFHEFGVCAENVKEPLSVLALSMDGFAEAVRHESMKIAAVQWHPERENPFRDADIGRFREWMDDER